MSDAAVAGPMGTGLSEVERVVDTFIAPTKTFTDILRSASWWLKSSRAAEISSSRIALKKNLLCWLTKNLPWGAIPDRDEVSVIFVAPRKKPKLCHPKSSVAYTSRRLGNVTFATNSVAGYPFWSELKRPGRSQD